MIKDKTDGRFNFTRAAIKRAIEGVNPPGFMKHYNFNVKGDKLFHEGKEVIPTEDRDAYLRKALYSNKSTKPFGRDRWPDRCARQCYDAYG